MSGRGDTAIHKRYSVDDLWPEHPGHRRGCLSRHMDRDIATILAEND